MINSNMNCCTKLINNPTILIFDSGVGGLFIYEELRYLLPYAHYLYCIDNDAFPYGNHSSVFMLDRVINIFQAICRRHRLDLAIIACNTVTVLILEKLRGYFFFPIIGVIPDIRSGMCFTRNGVIGLLATYKTVSSKFILNIINRVSLNYRFLLLYASELVYAVENKILYGKEVSITLLREILDPWLNIFKRPDTIILGCTHFLHLRNELDVLFSKKVFLIGTSARNVSYYIFLLLGVKEVNTIGVRVFEMNNRMYCTLITKKMIENWQPMLLRYNFSSLNEISIRN